MRLELPRNDDFNDRAELHLGFTIMKVWPKRYLQIFLQFSTAAANVNIGQFNPVLYPVHVFMVEALV